MSQHYSDPSRESDTYALPDVEVFQLTAREVAESADYSELVDEYSRRHEFRLANMNTSVRNRMYDALIAEEGITGGWFWQSCFPGCLPDSDPIGPFETHAEALADAQPGND